MSEAPAEVTKETATGTDAERTAGPLSAEPPPLPVTAVALAAKAQDLGALRDAVVDAASVAAGLWFSYIFVLLYLLVAVGSVTHRTGCPFSTSTCHWSDFCSRASAVPRRLRICADAFGIAFWKGPHFRR
jgi:hypothetical protein